MFILYLNILNLLLILMVYKTNFSGYKLNRVHVTTSSHIHCNIKVNKNLEQKYASANLKLHPAAVYESNHWSTTNIIIENGTIMVFV